MLSRFAPVAPLKVHKAMAEAGVLGTYHLLLAHQVLKDPGAHEKFYRYQYPVLPRTRGNPGRNGKPYIIMDNSLIELGLPLPVDDVLKAGATVGAKAIVLPDMLGDKNETLWATRKALDSLTYIRKYSPNESYPRHVKTLGVAQGQTLEQIVECAKVMVKTLKVDIISVPRHVTAKLGSRTEVTRVVAKMGVPIHLLGFSDNLWDDFWTLTTIPRVMGIDSAVPIWYGLQGFNFPTDPPMRADYGRRPDDYESQSSINQHVIANMRRVERWANTVRDARTGR